MGQVERVNRIKRLYGVNPSDYGGLLADQGGVCAICGHFPEEEENLCIDHDHRTGQIRGLLCSQCNLGIGNFKDDPEVIQNAITYLKRQ